MSPHKASIRRARLLPNGIPRWIRCYDNGGETIDRYTVVFTGRYTHKTAGEHWVLGMDAHPYHPQGFGQHMTYSEQVDCIGKDGRGYVWPPALGRRCHLGRRVHFSALPPDCQRVVLSDYHDLWDIQESPPC